MENLQLSLLTFPLWWYTTGWSLLWNWNKQQFRLGLQKTGILLFAHHIREPLYGDYTRSGIFLSFFLRLFLLVVKSVFLIFRILMLGVIDLVFLLSIPVVLAIIIYQFLPGRL